MIRLKNEGLEDTLAFEIVQNHWDNFIHKRMMILKRETKKSEKSLKEAYALLSKFPTYPFYSKESNFSLWMTPDVTLYFEGDTPKIEINTAGIPKLHLNHAYMQLLKNRSEDKETKKFITRKLKGAKWLWHNILQREETLTKVVLEIAKNQSRFFQDLDGKLVPMSMREIANTLQVHESTIARAVSHKYLASPRGLHPLNYFFSYSYASENGEKSFTANEVRKLLKEIIQNEPDQKPLSDTSISAELAKRGYHCSRRTIAKYRKIMNIGNAHQRKTVS